MAFECMMRGKLGAVGCFVGSSAGDLPGRLVCMAGEL